jgi:hypothetical protein
MDFIVFSPSLVTPGTLPEQCTGTRFLLGRGGDVEIRTGQPDALLGLPTVTLSVHKMSPSWVFLWQWMNKIREKIHHLLPWLEIAVRFLFSGRLLIASYS